MFNFFKKRAKSQRLKKLFEASVLIENDPETGFAHYEIGIQFFQEGMYVSAINQMEKSIQKYANYTSDDPEILASSFYVAAKANFLIGKTTVAINQYKKSLENYRALAKLQKKGQKQNLPKAEINLAETCLDMAVSYWELKNFQKALDYCSKALSYNRNSSEAQSFFNMLKNDSSLSNSN